AAVSECFTALGSPPIVRILSPTPDTQIMSNATLYLSGEAFDDRGRLITEEQLHWSVGETFAGTGYSVSVAGLPSGTSKVILTATDAQGRMSQQELVLNCGEDGQPPQLCSIGSAAVCETPPTISAVSVSPNVLWPPNHEMVPV